MRAWPADEFQLYNFILSVNSRTLHTPSLYSWIIELFTCPGCLVVDTGDGFNDDIVVRADVVCF